MIYVILTTLHFIFDWMLQPRSIAIKKGSDKDGINAVFKHILGQIVPFSIVFGGVLIYFDYSPLVALKIVLVNLLSHLIIDIFLPKGKTNLEMINWTALDQILHLNIIFYLISM